MPSIPPLAKGTKGNMERNILGEKRRGDCYKLLAASFYPPRKNLYLEEALFKSLAELFKEVCQEVLPFLLRMEEAFLTYSEEELSVEYARLFVGPFELRAPPYGSIYLDGERKVMGNSTMDVIRLYKKAGLVMAKDFKELPDHIAVELEFMYYLIYKEEEALEKSEKEKALGLRETRNLFFNQFLKPWIPAFCEKIREETENHFYIGLANCLSTFIASQSRNDQV